MAKGEYRLKIDVGEGGAFMGGMVKGKSIVSQKIGENKNGVDDKDPLSWNSVYIAKPNREKPFTTEAVCFVYAILEKPPDLEQYDKAGERGKKKWRNRRSFIKAWLKILMRKNLA